MSRVGIYVWAWTFSSIVLSADIAVGETFEERPTVLKYSALSSLLEDFLREKSALPLNIKPRTSTAKEAAAKQAERQAAEADAPGSESTHPPVVIAEGVIVCFTSPEIQALARKNLSLKR